MTEQNSGTPQGEQSTSTAQQQLFIQKIYVKDASFEAPNAPGIFRNQDWSPEVNVEMGVKSTPLGEGITEVVLTISVAAKHGDTTAYLVEIQQAGIFQFVGFDKEQKLPLLGSYCPNILFPYAREVVSDLIIKGGFPPYLLGPVNFDALYMQQLQKEGEGQAQASSETAH